MIQSCDIGSLPYPDRPARLLADASSTASFHADGHGALFEQTVVTVFLDKLKAGISIPTFPQFRDMNHMFLSVFEGLERMKEGYVETGRLTVRKEQGLLPEVAAIEKNAKEICLQNGHPFALRVCITGPYTLASFFPYRTSHTYRQLGKVLSEIVEKNVFAAKQGKVALVAIDEPLFGLVDDPLIDRGSEGREVLRAAWESIAGKARSNNVETCIHLHSTSDDLFWNVKSLKIIESHLSDPLYSMKVTKERLEKEDKLLKASIATSDFDQLIREKLGPNASNDAVADAWKNISRSTINPELFLEDVDLMKRRLEEIIVRFGKERVTLAGPECGLRGFPTYVSAIECLKRVSKAVE